MNRGDDMSLRRIGVLVLSLCCASRLHPARAQDVTHETPAQRDARMNWWRDARFGMFIHWGAYAVAAGTYKGERIPGIGEWIMSRAHVPIPDYEEFVHRFNPVRFDPDEWVRIAKDAGMKYIVITSKHHDGFAIFDSKVSRYDVVDATPYKRDALKALAQAAHRAGMRFGVYYSIMDWHHPEQQVPPEGLPGVDWETCMTMNDTWGYKSYDDDWKDTRTLLRTLIDVASKGGNFLLNVGPTADGVIPGPIVSRLHEMGEWMKTNGESIYGTSVSPYGRPPWGRYTAKRGKLYAHVFDWPKDGRLALTGVSERPLSAALLADGTPLTIERADSGFVVRLPRVPPSTIASVVEMQVGEVGGGSGRP